MLASLIAGKHHDNEVLTPGAGPNGGEFYLPYRRLHQLFAERGVELNTHDLNAGRTVDFELHVNAQHRLPQRPCYAYLYEHPHVRPVNGRVEHLRQYRKLFTWNDRLVDGEQFLKLDIPNDLSVPDTPGFAQRELFCVMVASNKALTHHDADSLYGKRLEAIRWFERHEPQRFALYGKGWQLPATAPGVRGRLVKQIRKLGAKLRPRSTPFPSYRGPVHRKEEVLQRARFSIAFENVRGGPGYITEKLFDCFASGCWPVYIGASNVADYIPAGCYVDADRFADFGALVRHLDTIDAVQFDAHRAQVRAFLASDAGQRFGNEYFCRTLVDGILADLATAPR